MPTGVPGQSLRKRGVRKDADYIAVAICRRQKIFALCLFHICRRQKVSEGARSAPARAWGKKHESSRLSLMFALLFLVGVACRAVCLPVKAS